jgi:hypothetical protein
MKIAVSRGWSWFSVQLALAAVLVVSAVLPGVAHACPMCFSGDNSDAFVAGSLLLMFVPTIVLGGFGYWAYRRIRAHELDLDLETVQGQGQIAAEPSRKTEASQPGQPGRLRVVE